MSEDTKIVASIVAVLAVLLLIFNSGSSDTPDNYYPDDMNSCIYTGVGGWDC